MHIYLFIHLPFTESFSFSPTGQTGLVAGWGKTDNSFGKTGTNILHKVYNPTFAIHRLATTFPYQTQMWTSAPPPEPWSQVLVPIIPNDECITWHEDKNIMVQVEQSQKVLADLILVLVYICCSWGAPEFTKNYGWILWRKGYESRWLVIVPLPCWQLKQVRSGWSRRKRELISAEDQSAVPLHLGHDLSDSFWWGQQIKMWLN